MAIITTVPDGIGIDLDSTQQDFVYNADGTTNYIQVASRSATYRQTFTYVAGKVSSISAWVKQ